MATNDAVGLAGPSRPLGAPDIPQFHLPTSLKSGIYAPRLYGLATVHFADRKRKIDQTRRAAFTLPLEPGMRTVDWDRSSPIEMWPEQLLAEAPVRSSYLPLPNGAMEVKIFTRWAKHFDRWLARTQRLEVPPDPAATPETPEATSLRPKRGGVSVELVAIVWELVPSQS